MKNFLSVILCAMILTCCTSGHGTFTVTATISELEDGTMLALSEGGTGERIHAIAKAPLDGGKVTFSDTTSLTKCYIIYVDNIPDVRHVEGALMFLASFGDAVTASAEAVENEEGEYSFIRQNISGSPSNSEYLGKLSGINKVNELYDSCSNAYQPIMDSIERVVIDDASYEAYLKTPICHEIDSVWNHLFELRNQALERMISENNSSWWGPFLMLNQTNVSPKDSSIYFSFPETVRNSYYGQIVYKQMFPETIVGKQAPDFVIPQPDGTPMSLHTMGEKMKIIDFWASWCYPCRMSLPKIMDIYREYHDKGLEIVSISVDTKKEDWLKAIEEEKIPWYNASTLEGFQAKYVTEYMVEAVPTFFLLDENNKVLKMYVGFPEESEYELKEILASYLNN